MNSRECIRGLEFRRDVLTAAKQEKAEDLIYALKILERLETIKIEDYSGDWITPTKINAYRAGQQNMLDRIRGEK